MLPEMPEPSGTTHIFDGQSWSGESDDRKTTKEKKKMPITLRLHWLDPERWDDVEGLTGRRV